MPSFTCNVTAPRLSKGSSTLPGYFVAVLILLLGGGLVRAQPTALDSRWTMSARDQSAVAYPGGGFLLSNISAGDRSPADFVSDRFVRVRGVGQVDGATWFATSSPFRIDMVCPPGQPNCTAPERLPGLKVIEDVAISQSPPPMPLRIRISTPQNLLAVGDSLQLTVTGIMQDGSKVDLTSESTGTTYATSNQNLATVSNGGLVTSDGIFGTVFVWVTNESATAVKQLDVVSDVITTTVEGFVFGGSPGTPLNGAVVTSLSFLESTTTDANGWFSLPIESIPSFPEVNLSVEGSVGGQTLTTYVTGLVPVSNGFTEAGVISLISCPPIWSGSLGTFDAGGWAPSVSRLVGFDDGNGTELYVTGLFNFINGVPFPNQARWNGNSWSAIPNVSSGIFSVVDEGLGSELYFSGDFTDGGGIPRRGLAHWDGTSWTLVGTLLPSKYVTSLAVFDDGAGSALYAAGSFDWIGGVVANNIARWDGATWSPLGTGTDNAVYKLAVFDDGSGPALYATGPFDAAGGVTVNYVAKWNGATWSALASGIGFFPNDLAVFDDGAGPRLFVSGSFTSAGGAPANRIAKWDGITWAPLGTGLNAPANRLFVFDDGTGPALSVGGNFTLAGGVSANRLAKWNGFGWATVNTDWMDDGVGALAVFDDGTGSALFVGGTFSGNLVKRYRPQPPCP